MISLIELRHEAYEQAILVQHRLSQIANPI